MVSITNFPESSGLSGVPFLPASSTIGPTMLWEVIQKVNFVVFSECLLS